MSPQQSRHHTPRILRVLIHIQNNLDEALSLRDLAEVAEVSPYHFHRVFRGMVGEPVLEHVRRLRLERAAHELIHTRHRVARIAFDAGYETHEAFTRAFKALFGLSPSAWRSARQPQRQTDPAGVHYSTDPETIPFHPLTEGISMDVSIVNRDPQRVVFIRHIGPYFEVGPVWERLGQWAGQKGLFGPNTRMFGLSYDDPDVTDDSKLRYDACITVGDEVEGEGEIGVQEVAGGTFGRFVHEGSYNGLATSYAAFFANWLPESGYEADNRPCIEIYLNMMGEVPEEELRTEILIPLVRAS